MNVSSVTRTLKRKKVRVFVYIERSCQPFIITAMVFLVFVFLQLVHYFDEWTGAFGAVKHYRHSKEELDMMGC